MFKFLSFSESDEIGSKIDHQFSNTYILSRSLKNKNGIKRL